MGRNWFSSQEVWGKVVVGQEPGPTLHRTGAPRKLPDQLPRLHPQLPGAGVLPSPQGFWRAVAESGGGAVLLRENGVRGCVPHTAPTHPGLGLEQGSRSKVECSHLLLFWLYSNGEFIQAGISYGCPALSALIKTTQTLLLMAGAVSRRGLQSLSISGPFPLHLSCSCACCCDHPLLPCVHPITIPSQPTSGCPGWAGALTLCLSSLMPGRTAGAKRHRSPAQVCQHSIRGRGC